MTARWLEVFSHSSSRFLRLSSFFCRSILKRNAAKTEALVYYTLESMFRTLVLTGCTSCWACNDKPRLLKFYSFSSLLSAHKEKKGEKKLNETFAKGYRMGKKHWRGSSLASMRIRFFTSMRINPGPTLSSHKN